MFMTVETERVRMIMIGFDDDDDGSVNYEDDNWIPIEVGIGGVRWFGLLHC